MRRQKFENAGIDRSLGRVKIHGGPTGCAFGAIFLRSFRWPPGGPASTLQKKSRLRRWPPGGPATEARLFFLEYCTKILVAPPKWGSENTKNDLVISPEIATGYKKAAHMRSQNTHIGTPI